MPEQINPFETDLITMEHVSKVYPPKQMLNWHPAVFEGQVLAIGRAIFGDVPRLAVDSLLTLSMVLARQFSPGNLWMLPTYQRQTYPAAVYWPLACAFRAEHEQGRRFDWFLWMDDDILCTMEDIVKLRQAADVHNISFIAACPYDRNAPHSPSIVENLGDMAYKWVKAPPSGSYPVVMTGFNLCLFRRDVFEKVPEPWFGQAGLMKGSSGMYPDWWWSRQMGKVGLQPWVCCDTNVTHLCECGKVDKAFSEQYFATHDVTQSGILYDKNLYISPNTGATMTVCPEFGDGRSEYEQSSNLGRQTDAS